jgi:hypothetical protein
MMASFDSQFGMRKSSSMPNIQKIPKNKAYNIKKASVLDIISTVESPSHWRYFLHKEEKKQSYLHTLKTGPFIAGAFHSGIGNTVEMSWKKRRQEKQYLNKVTFQIIQ